MKLWDESERNRMQNRGPDAKFSPKNEAFIFLGGLWSDGLPSGMQMGQDEM